MSVGEWKARWLAMAILAAGIVLVLAPAASAATITSAGPLTSISISPDLNCAVNHSGDVDGEFFGNTACATEISVGGTLYGPDSIPAGNSPGGYTQVSQSAVTGSGTNLDPYTIVTVVDVGTTGLRITETDSYVVGQESYRTDVRVSNSGGQSQSVILYRGGDCYLQNSDQGFGMVGNPAGAVACVAPADPSNPSAGPGSRIEQWVPLTAGSHYYEAFYGSVWSAMSAQANFPDTCDCSTYEDNGAGLSWALTIAAGGSQTVSHLTNFSPAGNLPLTTTKTADQSNATAGGQDGYTITLTNPNASDVQVASISDTLPAGFSYVAGTTSGVTTSNPTVSGQTLTWTGPFTDPAASGATPGSLTLHFDVTVSSTPGTYYNNATADGGSFSVVPTGDTAPVTVGAAATRTLSVTTAGTGSGSVGSSPAGIDCGATCSAGFADGTTVTLTATAATGSTFSGWSGAGCTGTGTCTITLTADQTVTATFTAQAHGHPAAPHSVGYWRNHPHETAALLPVGLGNYPVVGFDAAAAVFDANNCGHTSDGVGCLAAQLLGAKLNVANGADGCVAPTIAAADAFLVGVGYSGPGSYSLTGAQRAQAIALKSHLETYNTGGGC